MLTVVSESCVDSVSVSCRKNRCVIKRTKSSKESQTYDFLLDLLPIAQTSHGSNRFRFLLVLSSRIDSGFAIFARVFALSSHFSSGYRLSRYNTETGAFLNLCKHFLLSSPQRIRPPFVQGSVTVVVIKRKFPISVQVHLLRDSERRISTPDIIVYAGKKEDIMKSCLFPFGGVRLTPQLVQLANLAFQQKINVCKTLPFVKFELQEGNRRETRNRSKICCPRNADGYGHRVITGGARSRSRFMIGRTSNSSAGSVA